jgi:single-strand DNA-binding protein
MYINKVSLYGNLTRDPELKSTPSGMQVATFSIATNRVFKDKNGAKQEDVQFHNCVVWAQQAETFCRYMKKGSTVFVEGRLQTRTWDDKNGGGKRYATEIVVENFQFGPKAGGAESGSYSPPSTSAPARPVSSAPQTAPMPEYDTIEYPTDDVNPDDIPF